MARINAINAGDKKRMRMLPKPTTMEGPTKGAPAAETTAGDQQRVAAPRDETGVLQ